jgi:hypothetical protein
VPQVLIFKLEQKQAGITQQFPLHCEHENDKFLNSTVIGDESLIYHSKPDSRRQSTVSGVPSQKITSNEKIIQDCSVYSKITPTGFQDIKGVVHSKFMPIGTTINSKQYCEILEKVKELLQGVRPHIKPTFLQHDNARLHTSARTTVEIATCWFHCFGLPTTYW